MFIVLSIISKIIRQINRFFSHIFISNFLVLGSIINLETTWRTIMVSHEKSKNILGSRNNLYMFISFFSLSFVFLLMVHSSKNPSIIAHFWVDLGLGQGMSKIIQLPSDFWNHTFSEMFFYVLLTIWMIINYVFVIYTSFIIHWDPSPKKLELPAG